MKYVISTLLYTDSATPVHLQTWMSQLHPYNGTYINGFVWICVFYKQKQFPYYHLYATRIPISTLHY